MSRLSELEREVASAQLFAEIVQECHSEYKSEAYAQLSLVEQRLAYELENCNQAADLAWRGAVQSALKSGDMKRAKGIISFLKFYKQYPQLLVELEEWVK